MLRRCRLAAGLSQGALAERARLSIEAIGTLERGRRTAPRLETVRLLAEALALEGSDRAAFLGAARGVPAPRHHPPSTAPATSPLPAPPASQRERDLDEAAPDGVASRRELSPEIGGQTARRDREMLSAPAAGENRLLTILAADFRLADVTGVSISPEDRAEGICEIMRTVEATITTYGGTIQRLAGDDVLALFGTPQAHENDPERAILAALALRDALHQWGLQIAAGVETGAVYLGALGAESRRQIMAIGPAADLAARLREMAQPEQILAGPMTYRQIRRAFACGPLAPAGMGGRMVKAYAVAEALAHPEKARGIEGRRVAMIGREAELRTLLDRLTLVQSGQGQVVALIGEAGVGKSRLIAELKARALTPAGNPGGAPLDGLPRASADRVLWLEGRCLDMGHAAGYSPFLDMLHTYFAWGSGDDERTRGERIVAAVQSLVQHGALSPERGEEMLPVLGALLSGRFDDRRDDRLKTAGPEQIKYETFLTLRDLIVALARLQPTILVLEDLHWADSLSLDVTGLLMEAATTTQLLLVCIYRPTREHRSRHLGAMAARKCHGRYTELHLHDLPPPQSRLLLWSLLQNEQLPRTLKEEILAKTQGNPFFLEEVIRSLVETAQMYHDGTAWRARAEISAVAVPESVQGIILSRVDRLDATSSHVLQCAAVIGRRFHRRLLIDVWRGAAAGAPSLTQDTVAQLDDCLSALEDRQLIYLERTIPEEEYSFQHALTRETVYQNMLRRPRITLHRQVAEAMERIYGDQGTQEDYVEQLAHHYDQACAVDKAIAYLLRAGEKARRSYHNEEAASFFQRMLVLLEGSPIDTSQMDRRLAALQGLAHVCFAVGSVADAEGHFRQALALGRDLGLPSRNLTPLYFWLANLLWWQARFAEMQRLSEEGLALLGDDLESVAGVLMNHTVGLAYIEQGQIDRGNGFFLRNAACLEGVPYDADLKISYGDLIEAYLVVKKDIAAARRWLTLLEALAQHHREDLLLLAWVETHTALFLAMTGDVRGALGHGQRARDAFARCSTTEEGRSFLGTGQMHLSLGELGSAEEQAARGLSVLESVGAPGSQSDLHQLLGTTALCRRATETAVAHFQTAARLYRDAAQPWLAAGAAVALGRAFLVQGAYGAAVRAFGEAIHESIAVDQTPSPLRCFFGSTLPNALSGIEEASSSVEPVTAIVERLRQEFPAARSLPQTPCLHPAAAVPFRGRHVRDPLTGSLSAAWCWYDPQGDCSFTAQDGLLIGAANMRDLWHVNLSAPRLLRPAPSGDFAVQTIGVPSHTGADQPAIGGLILWQDPLHYLVLERGRFGAADISFRGCLDNVDCFIGRGRLPADRIWLRLERLGRRVTALCSADGQDWLCAGTIEFPTPDGVEVMVGLHAIGAIDRTIYHGAYPEGATIRFTTFEMWTTAAA